MARLPSPDSLQLHWSRWTLKSVKLFHIEFNIGTLCLSRLTMLTNRSKHIGNFHHSLTSTSRCQGLFLFYSIQVWLRIKCIQKDVWPHQWWTVWGAQFPSISGLTVSFAWLEISPCNHIIQVSSNTEKKDVLFTTHRWGVELFVYCRIRTWASLWIHDNWTVNSVYKCLQQRYVTSKSAILR